MPDHTEDVLEMVPPPGSDEAREQGCLCRILFCLGCGSGWEREDCPLHGEREERETDD